MQNFRQTGTFIALIGIFTLIVWMCKDNITNTISLENNLCYKKQHNNNPIYIDRRFSRFATNFDNT